MANNVIEFPGFTRLDIDPDKVLEQAKGELKTALIIGLDHEDDTTYFTSCTDIEKLLFMVEKFKFRLLRGDFNAE